MFVFLIPDHVRIMKTRPEFIKTNLPLLLVIMICGFIVFSRCANQGMPTGGPKDSIPPFLVETSPATRGLNFSGKEVRLTFNEFIIPDAVSEELVISPPLLKRPSVRTKLKTLIVDFNEDLKPDVTYSIDFKNSVVDNNERNPLKGLRLIFSTGSVVDTLRLAGVVKNAENFEPKEKILVMLYNNLNDTAVSRTRPDYVARTDNRGLFLFDNIKPGKYHLFALNDANSNLKYDAGAEEFAFSDSLIVPSAEYIDHPDTLVVGADSLLIAGHTLFKPEPVYLRTFTEKIFQQYLNKAIRESRYKCTFVFGESVKDSFNIRLLDRDVKNWYLIEPNANMDSLTFWVTDTLVAVNDTLKLELAYSQLDSLKHKYTEHDTIRLVYTEKERPETRHKKKENEVPEIAQFIFSDNVKSSGFNLNNSVLLTAPEPVKNFDFRKIKLSLADDSTSLPLKISVYKDTVVWRTYRVEYKWEPNTSYKLEIDSAACENIYGITNRKLKKLFITQKEDYYGKIILDLSSVVTPVLVQLLQNNKEESVFKTIVTDKNSKITFDFLDPAKYIVKIIYDSNNNGKWDPGNYFKKQQPERVAYLPEIIKVKSNWEKIYEWDLKPDPTFKKLLIDKEEVELQQKKQKEQRLKDKEKEKEIPADNAGTPFRLPGR